MNETKSLQERIESIVKRGDAVRQKVSETVAAASRQALAGTKDLTEVVQTTMKGASEALGAAVSADHESTLRQVVDGVGDGIATAAHAADLTLRETGNNVAAYAREDLDRLVTGFDAMSRQFVTSVVGGATQVAGQGKTQAKALERHATATLQRITPTLRAAAEAARRDPKGLVKGTMEAGVAAVRGATGALFSALGERLAAAGKEITPTDDEKS